jgi:maleate isomerase
MAFTDVRLVDGVELDTRPYKHRLGLVVLATDHVSEPELSQLVCGRGIGIYANRVPYSNPVTASSLRALAHDLTEAADRILPGEDLDALIFGCTAGAVAIGEERVVQSVCKAKPSVKVITPVSAAATGLAAMGAQRISMLTACDEETSLPIVGYFETKGFTVDRLTCIGLTDDRVMARISRSEIVRLAKSALHRGSDALYICGSATSYERVATS